MRTPRGPSQLGTAAGEPTVRWEGRAAGCGPASRGRAAELRAGPLYAHWLRAQAGESRRTAPRACAVGSGWGPGGWPVETLFHKQLLPLATARACGSLGRRATHPVFVNRGPGVPGPQGQPPFLAHVSRLSREASSSAHPQTQVQRRISVFLNKFIHKKVRFYSPRGCTRGRGWGPLYTGLRDKGTSRRKGTFE